MAQYMLVANELIEERTSSRGFRMTLSLNSNLENPYHLCHGALVEDKVEDKNVIKKILDISALKNEDIYCNKITNHDDADSNDLRELEDKANLKPPSNLMSLMQVYREAILNGDGKTVSDIEAKISIVEKEKNELV
ncbi:putative Protein grpE [Forsythia ovata]|uniref:Uncharacterized protein n=1 Tax=Forsythia ovata TaxID=205694 RepID=A0ABD1RKK4_9LAMI